MLVASAGSRQHGALTLSHSQGPYDLEGCSLQRDAEALATRLQIPLGKQALFSGNDLESVPGGAALSQHHVSLRNS